MTTHSEYSNFKQSSKKEVLQSVIESYGALSIDTRNWVANLANASSLIWHAYHKLAIPVNWAGFYVLHPNDPNTLILGPFQGKVACQTIQFGKGVCGTSAAESRTQLVPDVSKFPGHIACDNETKSEIVVPITVDGRIVGVLDIDCLELYGFDELDIAMLEILAQKIGESNDW